MLTAGRSTLERVVYRPDINQGNDLTANECILICVGMTTKQVANVLGTPLMSDPFGNDILLDAWATTVLLRCTQQTLTLTFNSSGVLTNIDNKPALSW